MFFTSACASTVTSGLPCSVTVAFWSMYAWWLVIATLTASEPATPTLEGLPMPEVACALKLLCAGASTCTNTEPAVMSVVPPM